jgi:hypothetical protein
MGPADHDRWPRCIRLRRSIPLQRREGSQPLGPHEHQSLYLTGPVQQLERCGDGCVITSAGVVEGSLHGYEISLGVSRSHRGVEQLREPLWSNPRTAYMALTQPISRPLHNALST